MMAWKKMGALLAEVLFMGGLLAGEAEARGKRVGQMPLHAHLLLGAFGTLGGQPHKCGAQPQKCGAQLRKCRGAAPKPRTPTPKISKGPKVTLWKDLCWGAWFSQALPGQVVGVRTLRAAPRGFGPKGRKRGPAEGGRGEVNLPPCRGF